MIRKRRMTSGAMPQERIHAISIIRRTVSMKIMVGDSKKFYIAVKREKKREVDDSQ